MREEEERGRMGGRREEGESGQMREWSEEEEEGKEKAERGYIIVPKAGILIRKAASAHLYTSVSSWQEVCLRKQRGDGGETNVTSHRHYSSGAMISLPVPRSQTCSVSLLLPVQTC